MATYNLTPAERRARAQAIVQARENRISYSNYLRDKKALEEMQEAERQRQLEEESRNNSANFLVRGLSTIGDVVGNVLTGAVKGLEGIVDLGIAAVGAVGGIFSDDFQDTMRQAVSYDFTGEIVGNPLQEAMKYSYLENGGIVEQISSGIGQMLPAVIATIATYGAYGGFAAGASAAEIAAAQAAAQTASLVTLGISAAGTSTEEAFNDGANYYAGLGYGVASGLVEVGTEKLFGGATKALTGAGVFDGITRSVAQTGWKRVALNALEEGAEEMISEAVNPLTKAIYKGKVENFLTGEHWKDIGTAGLVGSMTALAYSGSIGYGLSKAGIGYVGKEADISDSLTEISSLREKAINLQAEDMLDDVSERKIAETTKKNYQNIEGVLKSVSETRRAKLIEKFSLSKAFNADGTMSEQLTSLFNGDVTEAQVGGGTDNGDSTPLASPKKTSYSFSLRGNEATIQSDLDRLSENRAQAYLEEHQALGENITIEQAREAVGKFSVLTSEMSDKAQAARRKFNKALNALNKISGLNTSFVITEANETFDGSLVDDERMYISADAFENDTWAETVVHEYTHLEEGSEEYAKMVDFLQSDDILVDVEIDGEVKRIPLWQKAQAAVLGKDYGFDENKIKVISEKVNTQMGLTPEEAKLYKAFLTEVAAHETQYLLGTESFIDKVISTDHSFARKMIDRILNLKEAFAKVGDKATKAQLKMLRQAERLYLDAARKAGDMRLVKYILGRSPELEEEVDSDAQIVYNKKYKKKRTYYSQYNTTAMQWAFSSKTKPGDIKVLYNPQYNTWNKLVADDTEERYGTLLSIKDTPENAEAIRNLHDEVYNENHREEQRDSEGVRKNYERYWSLSNNLGDDNFDVEEQGANGRSREVHGGESEGDRSGDSRKSTRDNGGVKFALKDTVEQDVLAKYGKTYRWTEAGYILKDGTRLDLSGRNEGASGGYRTVDHRDIFDIYEDADDYGTDAMNQFMARGNIRVMPESPGINLQVEPTEEQYRQIQDLVERLGWKEKYFSVDFDDANGDTIDNITYEGAVSARKVVSDIKYFFKEGSIPHQSELSKFRYSLKEDSASAYEYEQTMKFSLVEDKKTLDFLNEQKHIKVYRAMQIIDGELYPPMAAKIKGDDGKTSLVEPTQLGKWYQADEHPELVVNGKFTLNKGNGSSITAAYNPYWHTSKSPLNDQFSSAYKRNNLVTVECEVPESELTSGYKAEGAKDSVGEMSWHSGQVSSKLSGEKTRKVILSRWVKVNRIVPDSEVASKIAKLLEGENVSIPDNTITPSLKKELEKLGVEITKSGKVEDVRYSLKEDSTGKQLSEGQKEFFKDSKVVDEQGRLLVVYHGTKDGNFYTFEYDKNRQTGTDYGKAFYFTTNLKNAKGYAKDNHKDLRIKEYEVKRESLKKQILAETDSAKRAELEKQFHNVKIDGKSILQLLYDVDYDTGGEVRQVYLNLVNPLIADGQKKYHYEVYPKLFKQARENGNDGIIVKNVDDSSKYGVGLSDVYIAFSPEQIKLVDNLNPTTNDDIRFSLKQEQVESLELRGITGNKLLDAIDLADVILSVNGEITDDAKVVVYHATSEESARKIIASGKMYGKEDNLFFSTKKDGQIRGYGVAVVETQIPIEKLVLNDIFDDEVHLTMSVRPNTLTNIRFNLVDDPTAKPYFYELTDGQVKKLLANSTKMKVYSKVESEGIINDILGNYMSFGDTYGVLSGKSKAEVIDMLWRGLNTAEPGRQAKVALDVAEYIIQHSVVESMYEDTDTEVYMDTIALLKPYLHKINLNGIKGEIKHRYDRDNSPYLLWGKRKGDSGLGADVIAMELDDLGFHIDAINEADIFFQIDEAYRSAVAGLKKEAKSMLDSALNAEERKQLKQEIARQVLIAFDEKGKPSKLSAFLEEYAKKAKVWREKYYEERSKNKLLNRVLDKIQKLKDIKLGTFLNASQFKNDVFKGSIERLANIKYRGNLNESGTRGILEGLAEWYVKENPMLQGVFDEDIASAILTLARGEGKLTVDELKALENVIDYFKHFVETYNKVWRGGQYVEAQPIAEKYVSIVRRNKPAKVGWLRKFFEKYETSFADPMTLVRYMDRYDDGFYTEILGELRKGAVGASIMEMEMREPLEAFYKKHKKFLKDMSTKTIEYQGTQIPLAQAMLLYMSLNRDQAILGLAKSGFTFNDGKETIRLAGFALEEDLEIEEIRVRAKEVQSALASQFTEVEKEYISIAEKLFNETCKEAKKKTDILRRGYTNALEDYYVPIRRANIAHNVDTSTFFDEMSRVSNASFNRDTVKGAKNELFIESLDAVLDRHIRAVAQYANLALAIDQYNLLYNLDIGDNPNKPTSVKTESVDMWSEGDAYFKKLISDIQGIPASKGDGVRFMGWLRGGYAKYQLGANPKVWVTQLSSFAAAGNILDIDCIIKGIGVSASDVDEYCGLAKVRNTENAAALAQGVIKKTGKVGDVLMKPIGMVDRFVIKRLFGACQLQIEKNEGIKVGTKENKVKAGELLEKVILETQQNALATERSSAMRSGSEFMKTITMFSADSMKVVGRVIDAIGEVSVLKAKRKLATDPNEIASLDKKIKAANKKARRAVGSLMTSAVFMALIAQCFRWLYNKDDEDDNVAVNMTVDAIGNLLGGLPLIRDIYSRFAEGYDFDNYAYSAINDMFDSAEKLFTTAGNIFEGDMDSREVASTIKNLLYAGGQMFGIPTRNIYNIFYGLTKRISPSTAYKIDDMFYKKSYRSDLAKAIERDDDAMIATITSLMLDENIGGIADSEARKELDSLVQKGFDVIPRSVSKKITYDGVEYELTPNQVKQFEKVYFVANEALASLVKMSQYKGATDEVKAKAVNFIYNVYYNLALQDFLGVDLETKSVLFAEAIDIEKLAIIVATANSIKADLDKKGVAISGTRKAKIQSYVNSLQLKAVEKYMIMGYLGYKNTKGEIQVKAYINRLSLTKTEKAKLLEYSGYAS